MPNAADFDEGIARDIVRVGDGLVEAEHGREADIVTLEERELFLESALRYMGEVSDLETPATATEDELDRFRAAYWAAARSCGVNPEGKIFVDKYPLNILKLPLIARLFPNARILLARRDLRHHGQLRILGCTLCREGQAPGAA